MVNRTLKMRVTQLRNCCRWPRYQLEQPSDVGFASGAKEKNFKMRLVPISKFAIRKILHRIRSVYKERIACRQYADSMQMGVAI